MIRLHECKRSPFFALLVTITTSFCLSSVAPAQTFTDVTSTAGITHVHAGGFPMTAGAAAGDVDGDGWCDLFVSMNGVDILYRNRGDGTFKRQRPGGSGFRASIYTNGAAFGDIDNDGDLDLYLTSVGESQYYLYINNGSGFFTEDAVSRNADVAITGNPYRQGEGVCVGDSNNDGYLDIFTGEWRASSTMTGADDAGARLLINQGVSNPGYFTDTTDAAGVWTGTTTPGNQGLFVFAPRFADVNNDGLQDLCVVSDFGNGQLFLNDGDGTYTDVTSSMHVGTAENGMGTDIADWDNDGDLDWFVTAIALNGGNRMFENQLVDTGSLDFLDSTDSCGVRDGGWGWGSSFIDYDNDGHLDIVMTNGWPNQNQNPKLPPDLYLSDQMRLWHNNANGTFAEVATDEGISDTGLGRGLLTFDYDKDGDLDIFVCNWDGSPVLYRNETNTLAESGGGNDWLIIDTIGRISNHDGIGARIKVDPDQGVSGDEQHGYVDAGSNFLAQSHFDVHFGLGNLGGASIDLIEIKWPSGVTQKLFDVVPNQSMQAIEPSTVLAEETKLRDGVLAAGQLSDLSASDDLYYELEPAPTPNFLEQKVYLIIQSTSPTDTPSDFKLRLESVMTGGPSGDVIQTVEMMNYDTGMLELLDLRSVAITDESIDVTPAGDVSRFIKPITNEITAHITWNCDLFSGTEFLWYIDLDEAVWLVTD